MSARRRPQTQGPLRPSVPASSQTRSTHTTPPPAGRWPRRTHAVRRAELASGLGPGTAPECSRHRLARDGTSAIGHGLGHLPASAPGSLPNAASLLTAPAALTRRARGPGRLSASVWVTARAGPRLRRPPAAAALRCDGLPSAGVGSSNGLPAPHGPTSASSGAQLGGGATALTTAAVEVAACGEAALRRRGTHTACFPVLPRGRRAGPRQRLLETERLRKRWTSHRPALAPSECSRRLSIAASSCRPRGRGHLPAVLRETRPLLPSETSPVWSLRCGLWGRTVRTRPGGQGHTEGGAGPTAMGHSDHDEVTAESHAGSTCGH